MYAALFAANGVDIEYPQPRALTVAAAAPVRRRLIDLFDAVAEPSSGGPAAASGRF